MQKIQNDFDWQTMEIYPIHSGTDVMLGKFEAFNLVSFR